jgi:hypothetical protein
MKVSTSDLMAVKMTASAVTRALVAGGLIHNEVKSVQQDDNLCLFWHDDTPSFIIAPVSLKMVNDNESPVVMLDNEHGSIYKSNSRGTIVGSLGQIEIEYEALLFALEEDACLELAENPDKHVTHENLKYCDVFTTGLMMKYLGNEYTAQGVNMEQKQVLLEQHGKFVEYSFVLKDNNDFEIVGLPIRQWA